MMLLQFLCSGGGNNEMCATPNLPQRDLRNASCLKRLKAIIKHTLPPLHLAACCNGILDPEEGC